MANSVNQIFNRLFKFNFFSKSFPINITSQRTLCSQISFKEVYSDENLQRCLKDLNGLHYHNSNIEEKQKFFEIKKKDAKKAAVLVPFCYDESNQPSILFTLRSANLAVHKWEVSFPGGKLCDLQDDGDIAKTAARETKEELGITDESIDVIGVLNYIPGKQSKSFIFPVLAKIDLKKQGSPNIDFPNKCQEEVEEVIIRPLSELVKEQNWAFTHWKRGITTPIYRDCVFDDRIRPRVWGLSSYILFQILANLVPDQFKLKYSTLMRYEKIAFKPLFLQ